MIDIQKDLEQATLELGDVESKIREIICKVCDCIFVGPIIIVPLKPYGYQVKFSLPDLEKPVSFAAELPDDLFFKHAEEVLKECGWKTVEHYRLQLFYPYPN